MTVSAKLESLLGKGKANEGIEKIKGKIDKYIEGEMELLLKRDPKYVVRSLEDRKMALWAINYVRSAERKALPWQICAVEGFCLESDAPHKDVFAECLKSVHYATIERITKHAKVPLEILREIFIAYNKQVLNPYGMHSSPLGAQDRNIEFRCDTPLLATESFIEQQEGSKKKKGEEPALPRSVAILMGNILCNENCKISLLRKMANEVNDEGIRTTAQMALASAIYNGDDKVVKRRGMPKNRR